MLKKIFGPLEELKFSAMIFRLEPSRHMIMTASKRDYK